MKTLCLRNVPEAVTARLDVLAARAGMSVSAFAVRELGEIARRADNPALLDRVWSLRENLMACDATYVALAEALDCPLLTTDPRLGRAPGSRCPVTVVRS